MFILAFFSLERTQLTKLQKTLIAWFIITTFYLIIIGLTLYVDTGFTTRAQIRNLLMSILIFIIVNDEKFNVTRLINLFVFLAFILSLLAVIQFVGFYLGVIYLKPYVFKTGFHE